ncbi:diguanylate cyclase [Vibrio sp.]|uniref:GGDEF domain-containing protein n=1 Tax=Vibrio sp. TaxID=678 RepID=UPI003D1185C8
MKQQSDEYEEYAAVIASLPDKVFVLTESGRYAAIMGGDSDEYYHDGSSLAGLMLSDVLPVEKSNWFLQRIKETLEANKLMVFEYGLSADDVDTVDSQSGPAGELWFEGRVMPLKSLRYGERAVVWVARNITKRHHLEQQLTYQSEIDFLTNSYNRRKLFEELNNAFYKYHRYQEQYSFLLIDLDDFKQINDAYGHKTGDDVLRKLTAACQAEIRQTDVIGRLGGDEFAIIHQVTANESSYALATRLVEMVASQCGAEQFPNLNLTISVGISQFQERDQGVENIYQRADLALYESKRNGKNRICLK